jgi:prefoldin subunit 5
MNRKNKSERTEKLESLISFLKEHEKDMDRIINSLEITKNMLTTNVGKLNQNLEKISTRASSLERDLKQLIKITNKRIN